MSDKLKVYGLFKQATIGDNETTAPWAVQLEAKSKWDAWTANKGKSQKQAKAEYIANIKKWCIYKETSQMNVYIYMKLSWSALNYVAIINQLYRYSYYRK